MSTTYAYNFRYAARDDFDRISHKATLNRLASAFAGRDSSLPSFNDLDGYMPASGRSCLRTWQVPVARIVGSVGRSRDFNRDFQPVQKHTRPRWESIYVAAVSGVTLPPVELYKVGDCYFVKDGNHRVSVARYLGAEFVDAEVTEYVELAHEECEDNACALCREVCVNSARRVLGRLQETVARLWPRPRLRATG
ncbi:MAG TPA: hypothetical protein VEX13_11345 [Chloroflexia bacterium]|nr:hypothetical protein [Chloroflexia bacterium]